MYNATAPLIPFISPPPPPSSYPLLQVAGINMGPLVGQ